MPINRLSFALAVKVAVLVAASQVSAQTVDRPTHIPTPQAKDSPFGTQWAKPPGTTGSYIYDDPRRMNPTAPYNPNANRNCSAPTLYDPVSGRCK